LRLTGLRLHTLALLVYPGLLTMVPFGLLAEVGACWLFASGRARERIGHGLRQLSAIRVLQPTVSGAALLALLAASQLAAPFNPVPEVERNLLVAGAALAGTVWLAWPVGLLRHPARARVLLAAQAGWLAALLLLGVVTDTLRPQSVGAVMVGPLVPAKLTAGLLYVICLPGLLGLEIPVTGSREAPSGAVRLLLWLPLCGLFASLLFPPASDDLAGLARFGGACSLGAVLALIVAGLVSRAGAQVRAVYPAAVVVLTLVGLAIATVTVLIS
jgi:hypothetical protein